MALIVLSLLAKIDLAEIWEFIADDSDDQADAFIDLIDQKVKLLAVQPAIGRRRDELADDLRSFRFVVTSSSLLPFAVEFRSCACSMEPETLRWQRRCSNDHRALE